MSAIIACKKVHSELPAIQGVTKEPYGGAMCFRLKFEGSHIGLSLSTFVVEGCVAMVPFDFGKDDIFEDETLCSDQKLIGVSGGLNELVEEIIKVRELLKARQPTTSTASSSYTMTASSVAAGGYRQRSTASSVAVGGYRQRSTGFTTASGGGGGGEKASNPFSVDSFLDDLQKHLPNSTTVKYFDRDTEFPIGIDKTDSGYEVYVEFECHHPMFIIHYDGTALPKIYGKGFANWEDLKTECIKLISRLAETFVMDHAYENSEVYDDEDEDDEDGGEVGGDEDGGEVGDDEDEEESDDEHSVYSEFSEYSEYDSDGMYRIRYPNDRSDDDDDDDNKP